MQVGRTKTVAPLDGVGKPQFVQEGAHTAEEEAEALEVLVAEMPGASTKLHGGAGGEGSGGTPADNPMYLRLKLSLFRRSALFRSSIALFNSSSNCLVSSILCSIVSKEQNTCDRNVSVTCAKAF